MRSRAQLATLAERQRLARDLHDTVKQKAFALNLQLATARRLIGETQGSDRLEQAQRLSQQIQQELAQILDELRASDTDLPLIERLRQRAIEWSHTSGLMPAFTLDDLPPLPGAQEESLLRIVDEALANVLRHAGATRVEIMLRRDPRQRVDPADLSILARAQVHGIAPIEQLERRLQQVIAVGTSADDVQEQVQLGWRRPCTPAGARGRRAHQEPHSRTARRTLRSPRVANTLLGRGGACARS